jgi:hypothetical protein
MSSEVESAIRRRCTLVVLVISGTSIGAMEMSLVAFFLSRRSRGFLGQKSNKSGRRNG